jgi:hypothetical protein
MHWLLNNTAYWAGLNKTSWTPMDLLDNDVKTFAAIIVVLPIIILHVMVISIAFSCFLERLVPCASSFLERLRLRIERVVRENSPMILLMIYLGNTTTIFEQYPFVKPLMWLSYVVLFCMDDALAQ